MPSSWVSVANGALSRLGARLIASLDESTPEALRCNSRYEACRDIVLRSHPWGCALKRTTLAAQTTPPDFGWQSSFTLPADCIRIWKVLPEGVRYEKEGTAILADANALQIRYIRQITDPTQLDALLADAISAYLAYDLCPLFKQDAAERDSLLKQYEFQLRKARSVDSQENGPEAIRAEVFIDEYRGSPA